MDGTECMALKRTEKMNNDDMQKMCEYSPRTQLFITAFSRCQDARLIAESWFF